MTVDFIDPMDAVISQLQPRDTRPEAQQIDPQPQAQDPKPTEPAQPVEPVQPSEPINPEPVKEPEPTVDIEKEIDDLLELVKKEPVKESETKPDVNTIPEKKVVKVPKFLEKGDNQQLSVDEMEEITNYIYDLEEQLANIEFDKKRESVEKSQLEQMLEKERAKSNEVFDKLKELEREIKKAKSVTSPDELQTLIDYYKLNKENPSLYNKRNLV